MSEHELYSPTVIRRPLPKSQRLVISAISIVFFIAMWVLLTLPIFNNPEAAEISNAPAKIAITPANILPSPISLIYAIGRLHTESGLIGSALTSFFRVTVSFILAVLVAFPLGVAMASWQPLKSWIQPIMDPLRFLPLSAVTALFILWFGIAESQKIAFLFAGTIVYLLPLIVEEINRVEQEYIDTALTLGANPLQLITGILIPSAMPGIWESMRVIYGVGWTYVILAEIVKSGNNPGIGALIWGSQRQGRIDEVFALLVVVLVIAVISNEFFVQISKAFFSWKKV